MCGVRMRRRSRLPPLRGRRGGSGGRRGIRAGMQERRERGGMKGKDMERGMERDKMGFGGICRGFVERGSWRGGWRGWWGGGLVRFINRGSCVKAESEPG